MVQGLVLEERPEGVILKVRATPGASRDGIVGVLGDSLKIAVSAAAEKGKANKRILAVLAKKLGLPARSIILVSGQTSRDKLVCVKNTNAEDLRRTLETLLHGSTSR